MIKTIARALAITAVAATPVLAQSAETPQFQTGAIYAGPRVWIGNLNGSVAIGGQVERGFTEPGKYGPGIIAGGVGVDYYSWSWSGFGGSWKYSVIPIQAFSNYHFVIEGNKKIDPYLGVALVYQVVSASWSGSGVSGSSSDGSTLDFAGQAGVRYFLTEKLALQGQVGFGYGTLGLGATWKF